jgi:cytochrome c nitrite reductase small subunit
VGSSDRTGLVLKVVALAAVAVRKAAAVSRRRPLLATVVGSALLAVGVAFSVYAVRATSTPEFCGMCHVMTEQYEDWFYSGSHARIACIDCHLPNDNAANHFLWKGIDGVKDVALFYTRLFPEMIRATSHARKTVQANCVRCHEEAVSRISAGAVRCWECHRGQYHNVLQ